MTYRKEQIIAGGIYHVLSRGVDKRDIFMDDEDRLRFIENLFKFNDKNFNSETHSERPGHYGARGANGVNICDERSLLVELLSFSLMPNHYHLLIKPLFDDGLFKFVQKLNHGYAQYFNKKIKRQGSLFESRYKVVPIINEAHFTHIPYYIHLNPLDLIDYGWREGNLGDLDKAIDFLNSYRWSSHLDYTGVQNFPSVTKRDFLLSGFDGTNGYKKSIRDWLSERTNFGWMKGISLE